MADPGSYPIPFLRSVRLWPRHESRRTSWLELFFDLIFVAAVSQVGIPLGEDYSTHGLVRYSFMFLLIWLAWFGHTMYSTRFDSDDVVHRALTLVQIFAAAAMAANAKQGLSDRDSAGFGAAYAVQRIVLVVQYMRARREARTRTLTTIHVVGFGVAAVLWIVAALTPTPARFWLWSVALAVDLATPWFAAKYTRIVPPHPEHLPERLGLFTIILLGESVAAVMRGMESQESWPISAAVSAFAGLALVFGLWWWYFDVARGAAERRVESAKEVLRFHVWSHVHFPLYLSIAVLGVGTEHIISLPSGARFSLQQAWILIGASSVLMASLIIIGLTSSRFKSNRSLGLRFLVLTFLVPAALLVGYAPSCVLVLLILFVCVVQILLGQASSRWFRAAKAKPLSQLEPQPVEPQ